VRVRRDAPRPETLAVVLSTRRLGCALPAAAVGMCIKCKKAEAMDGDYFCANCAR
jgi:hypothetical protein